MSRDFTTSPPSSLKLGVVGFYGFGNAGDEAIFRAIANIFHHHRCVPVPIGLPDHPDTFERLNAFDLLILGGGQLFQYDPPSPFGSFHRWYHDLTPKIGVLGIGVSQLRDRFREAVSCLIERSVFFVVRDEESREILGHDRVQVAPDLTFYTPLEFTQRTISARSKVCGVNLRGPVPNLHAWIEAIGNLPLSKQAVLLSTHPTHGEREFLAAVGLTPQKAFAPDSFAEIDVLVGTAFHSVVFAIQSGTPVVAINYDPKVERLMKALDLSGFLLEWNQPAELQGRLEQALAERDAIQKRMLEYRFRAKAELQECVPLLLAGLNAANRLKRVPSIQHQSPSKVSVIIGGKIATKDDALRTINSCFGQRYPNLEVIALVEPEDEDHWKELSGGFNITLLRAQRESSQDNGFFSHGVRTASGTYLSCLKPGSWLNEEALCLLVNALERNSWADCVHASYFLTRNGIIERKVSLDCSSSPNRAVFLGPCVLFRGNATAKFIEEFKRRGECARPRRCRALYFQPPLFFRPSTAGEHDFLMSLMALRRGDESLARKLMMRALEVDDGSPELRSIGHLTDAFVRIAGNSTLNAGLNLLLDECLDGLSKPTRRRIVRLRHKIIARSIMGRFFDEPDCEWPEMFHLAFKAAKLDAAWLTNRGLWAQLFKTPFKSIASSRTCGQKTA